MRFKHKNMTLTQLGQLFGGTSHDVGKWLLKLGLRDKKTKQPTWEAKNEGYCEWNPSGQHCQLVWNTEKTVAALKVAGHKMVPDPPEDLVELPLLNGPFQISGINVLNADGSLAARTTSRKNAEVFLSLLQMAHKTGAIVRLLTPPTPAS